MSEQRKERGTGFLISTGLVLVIVVLGTFLTYRALTSDDPNPSPSPTTAPVAVEPLPEAAPSGEESVCGLPDGDGDRVPVAPKSQWDYIAEIGVPSSTEFGPGEVDENGVRYCFQRSPEGALFMAGNGFAQSTLKPWAERTFSDGEQRETLLSTYDGERPETPDARMQIVGFRVLDYSSDAATVDLAWRGTVDGDATYMSTLWFLVWENGDWKLDITQDRPMKTSELPDTTGYIPWGE